MDQYGIGAAVKAVTEVYFQSARRTGRTTALVKTLKPGDVVVCMDENHERHLGMILRERQVEGVKIIIADPRRSFDPLNFYPQTGHRLFFDHTFVEEKYRAAIEGVSSELRHWGTEKHLLQHNADLGPSIFQRWWTLDDKGPKAR